MSRKTKIWMGLVLACGVIVALGLTFGKTDDSEAYSWAVVSRGEVRETLQASGECQARTRINIGSSSAGVITGLYVKDGQEVAANQVLVTIDSGRLKQELAQTQAMLDAATKDAERLHAAMQQAKRTFASDEVLYKQGILPENAYRDAKLARDSAELSYESARANIAQNGANVAATRDTFDKTVIRAPIAGRVTSLNAEKGEIAIPGLSNLPGTVLMVISDTSDMIAEVKVNEAEVVRLRAGQPAQVSLESLPGHVFHGSVFEIASAAQQSAQESNMYRVKIALDRTDPLLSMLRPGMSARGVILTADVKNVLRVPLQAVLEREGSIDDAKAKGLLAPETRFVVMVVDKNGTVRERVVKTGIADSQFYQVLSGLSAGDRVLTGPIRKLKDLKDRSSIALRHKSDEEIARDEARKS